MSDAIVRSMAAGLAGLKIVDETLRHNREMPNVPTRSARVEAGLAAIEEAEREREQLRSALQAAEADVRGLRAELEALTLAYTRAQSDCERYQRDRDAAVDGRVKADALLDALLTLLQKHRGPTLSEERRAREDEAAAYHRGD